MDIDKPEGRELRVLVAEKIMGWWVNTHTPEIYEDGSEICIVIDPDYTPRCPHKRFLPDLDIAAAWLVLEKMREMGFGFTISDNANKYAAHIDCRFWNLEDDQRRGIEISETAPLAICRAAWKAVETEGR